MINIHNKCSNECIILMWYILYRSLYYPNETYENLSSRKEKSIGGFFNYNVEQDTLIRGKEKHEAENTSW